jgi:hypothetical protein
MMSEPSEVEDAAHKIALVIPVRHDPLASRAERLNRADALRDCLISALEAAEVARSPVDIVVVDDHSPSDIRASLDAAVVRRIEWVASLGAHGQAGALNFAMSQLRCDIFALTDSDCVVERTWFNAMNSHLTHHPENVGVGGPTWLFRTAKRAWSRALTSQESALMHYLAQSDAAENGGVVRRVDCRNLALRSEFVRMHARGTPLPLLREDGSISVSGQLAYDLRDSGERYSIGFCPQMQTYHAPVPGFRHQLQAYYARGRRSNFDEIYARPFGSLALSFRRRYARRHFLAPVLSRAVSPLYVWPLHTAFWTGILMRRMDRESSDRNS